MCCTKKSLSRKMRKTLESEAKPFMPREAAVSAHSLSALPAWQKNVIESDMGKAHRWQHEVVAHTG